VDNNGKIAMDLLIADHPELNSLLFYCGFCERYIKDRYKDCSPCPLSMRAYNVPQYKHAAHCGLHIHPYNQYIDDWTSGKETAIEKAVIMLNLIKNSKKPKSEWTVTIIIGCLKKFEGFLRKQCSTFFLHIQQKKEKIGKSLIQEQI
jgi:hypothetical protein